jgi:hypothetical protein
VCHQWECKDLFFKCKECSSWNNTKASRSYLTCQNEFRDTFIDSSVQKEIDGISSDEPFRDIGVFTGLHERRGSDDACVALPGGHFQHLT